MTEAPAAALAAVLARLAAVELELSQQKANFCC
jgi:hypothetical protein